MRIDPKDSIAGVPMLKVREFMRWARGGLWTLEKVEYRLRMGGRTTEEFVRELERRGLVERLSEYADRPEPYYRTTIKGNALAMASAGKPIRRPTAQRLVSEFMSRVRQANEDDYFLYRVARVIVFGSYLDPGVKTLGDVDLAIDLLPKHIDKDKQATINEARIEEAHAKGRQFRNIVDQLMWPQTEVKAFLRSRSVTEKGTP